MDFHEVSDNLLEGQLIRSESFGRPKKYLKIVNGGVYVVNHLDQLEPWNATFDITKKDWFICDEDCNKIQDSEDSDDYDKDAGDDLDAYAAKLKALKPAELLVEATNAGLAVEAGANKASLIKLLLDSKSGGSDA